MPRTGGDAETTCHHPAFPGIQSCGKRGGCLPRMWAAFCNTANATRPNLLQILPSAPLFVISLTAVTAVLIDHRPCSPCFHAAGDRQL